MKATLLQKILTCLAALPLAANPNANAQDAPAKEPAPAPKEQSQTSPPAEDPKLSGHECSEFCKSVPAVLNLYLPVVAEARMSTAQVYSRSWNKRLALAAVVHESGYLITKASEVEKTKDLGVAFAKSEAFPAGLKLGAKVVDTYPLYDLALLKVDGSGFRPVRWSDGPSPVPGSMLAAPGLESTPVAIGVASVDSRNLDDANKGFLGVGLEETDKGLAVARITANSAATEAGLQVQDILVKVNGKSLASREDFMRTIAACKPAEKITLRIKRGEEERELEAVLRRRGDFKDVLPPQFEDPRNSMSGALSKTRSGFPSALQHDLFLQPYQCGGPVVNLDGAVVGVNIARSGRIESLAIPASTLQDLLREVAQGHFFRPEVEDLKKKRDGIASDQKKIEDSLNLLKKRAEDLDRQINQLLGKPAGK